MGIVFATFWCAFLKNREPNKPFSSLSKNITQTFFLSSGDIFSSVLINVSVPDVLSFAVCGFLKPIIIWTIINVTVHWNAYIRPSPLISNQPLANAIQPTKNSTRSPIPIIIKENKNWYNKGNIIFGSGEIAQVS